MYPTAESQSRWVVFTLEGNRYALPLTAVQRVVRAVQITPLPRAPAFVLGAIDVEGQVLPVFSLRQRFDLQDRPIHPADQFLIAHTPDRSIALVIDAALGIIEYPVAGIVDAQRVAEPLEHIQGVIPLESGMLLIQDLGKLLTPQEAQALDEAMSGEDSRVP